MGNKAAKTAKAAQEQQIKVQKQAAQQAEVRRQEAVGVKRSAIENIKFPTYLSTESGQKYSQTLQDRIAGRGLIDVDALTAPVANQVRAGLVKTNAAIASAASARGLGRSSVVGAQMGEESRAAERDIAERVAQLEVVRHQQIQDAVSAYGALSETEATSQANKSIFDRSGQFSLGDTIAGYAEQAKNDQFMVANSIAQMGIQQAAMQLQRLQMFLGAGASVAAAAAGGAAGGGAAGGASGATVAK